MQPEQLEALAGEVALLIKAALGPVLERLAVAEAQVAALSDLRDRVLVVETKATMAGPVVLAPAVLEAPGLDLSPVLERVAAAEARLEVLGDLRDRVVTIETKVAIPLPPVDLGGVPDRLAAVEHRAGTAVVDLQRQVSALEQTSSKDAIRLEGYTAALQRDAAALSERIAIVETRAPVPGPAGTNGRNGVDGPAGADGLGFDDLAVSFDGYNMLTFAFTKAGVVKSFPVSLPFLRYQGVHQHSQKYFPGDVVTWAGSTWHCNEPTTAKPDEGSKAWTLMVKRGRDGKDGQA